MFLAVLYTFHHLIKRMDNMTTLDLHIAPARRATLDGSSIAAILAAIALVVVMGVPALMAPQSKIAAQGWHGNSASSVALR